MYGVLVSDIAIEWRGFVRIMGLLTDSVDTIASLFRVFSRQFARSRDRANARRLIITRSRPSPRRCSRVASDCETLGTKDYRRLILTTRTTAFSFFLRVLPALVFHRVNFCEKRPRNDSSACGSTDDRIPLSPYTMQAKSIRYARPTS